MSKRPRMKESDEYPAEAEPTEGPEGSAPEDVGAADAAQGESAPDRLPDEDEPVSISATEWAAVQDAKAALEDRLLRLQAEFENYRKRTARERTQSYGNAVEEVTRSFLPVVDNCDRAIAAAETEGFDEEHLAGWRLIHRQLYEVLRTFNVQPLSVVGELFNPNVHDAVAEMPDDRIPPGHVVQEVERGYMIGDRVLRTAKVVVSRGPAEQSQEEGR